MPDPFDFLTRRYEKVAASHPKLTPAEMRTRLIRLLGVVDEPWPDVDPEVANPEHGDGFNLTAVRLPSRVGWTATGYLLVPDKRQASASAVICLPGHGVGVDAIIGRADEPYQANFALECVRRGWIALAMEQVSFGGNKSGRDADKGSSCAMDSLFAIELGETMTGWRVRDAMAGVRFLRTLPEVDGARIATLGISGGGLTSLFAAAIDESICAAGVSGYFTPMAHSILSVDHCPDNYVPGLARLLDVPDLARLIAPRWLAVENGTRDPIFAIQGFREACELARETYADAGCPERFVAAEFEGEHEFRGAALLESLQHAFGFTRTS